VTRKRGENVRSRRTRAAILTATRAIIEEHGFDGLTMDRVARRAGVTRRAVYLHFPSQAVMVNALFAFVAQAEGLAESTRRVWAAAGSVAALDEWAKHLARYHPRLLPLALAVDRVRRTNADAALHHQHVVEAQRANCRRLAMWLYQEGQLAPLWTIASATDMLWSLISSEMVEKLIVDRRWTAKRFADRLSHLLRSTFARDPRMVRPPGDEPIRDSVRRSLPPPP
jgi:AcrR family transcriptional regulator